MTGVSGRHEHEVQLARILFHDLAVRVDAALGEKEGVEDRLDTSLELVADIAREGDLGRAAFAGMTRDATGRLEKAFTATRSILAETGIDIPEPEEFWATGIDPNAMSRSLEADATLVPVPTPYGLGVETWMELFRGVARAPDSPLSREAPLKLATEISANFEQLDEAPQSVPAISGRAGGMQRSLAWTLRLIPAASAPPQPNLNHSFGPHPTLPEMLMLQLLQIITGEEVVDRNSFTWLHGTLNDGRFAARHFFDVAQRSAGVNTREIGNQGPHLGVRTPIG